METVAIAIDEASSRATCSSPYNTEKCSPIWNGSKKDLSLLLVTKAWWESRLSKNVHEGRCRSFECDAITLKDGSIVHLARTPWQLQRTSYVRSHWDDIVGTDIESTKLAAWAATKVLSAARNRCHTIQGTLAGYASSRCEWPGAARRYLFWEKLSRKTEEQFVEDAEKRRREHESEHRDDQTVASR